MSWNEAFDVMAAKWKEALKAGGPTTVGMFGSGQWTIWEGYAAAKLLKAGFRSNNLDPNARHCMASAVAGFMRTFGIDEPMGCYDDLEHADAFVLWGSNMAEMHPVLWTRITDRRLMNPHVKVAVLSTYQHRGHELADLHMIFTPQTDLAILNFIAHHIISTGRVNKDFVGKHVNFALGNADIGYGLRPEDEREKRAKNAGDAEGDEADLASTNTPSSFLQYTRRQRIEAFGRPRASAHRARGAVRRPEAQGGVALDHGLQPAHARHLGEPALPQRPPAHRQDRRAGQPPVLAYRPALGVRHGARGRHVLASTAGRHGGDEPEAPRDRREDLEAARRARSRRSPATTRCCRTGC